MIYKKKNSTCFCLFLWLTYISFFLKGDDKQTDRKNMEGVEGVISGCCFTKEVITLQPKC